MTLLFKCCGSRLAIKWEAKCAKLKANGAVVVEQLRLDTAKNDLVHRFNKELAANGERDYAHFSLFTFHFFRPKAAA